jgi:FixJ family two-component response regulator
MIGKGAVVIIVDDDPSLRTMIGRLLDTVGLKSISFAAPEEFLRASPPDGPACLVLDVQMPGLSGLDLQRELARAGHRLPIVFMTGHGDIPMTVQAMKEGAVAFLTKPFRNQDLLDAVREALNLDSEARQRREQVADLRKRYESLTAREREVFALVARGLLNKQIALQLGTTERTVKAHRGVMVQKMQAESVADLVRMADRLGVGVQTDSTASQ